MRCYLLVVLIIGALVSGGCRRWSPAAKPSAESPATIDLLTEPTGELLEETWAAHTIRGAKVGHRHTRVFRIRESSPPLLQIVAVDRLELRRFR